jgi:D-cysteine desulfhydrase
MSVNLRPLAGLVTVPPRLERWDRLGEHLGVEVLAKREDVSGIGLGGNKLRKLDLILGQAIQDEIDTVITVGGLQSNHCRLTAATAARLGLRCVLFLRGGSVDVDRIAGNVLMDRLFGAEVHVLQVPGFSDLETAAEQCRRELELAGRRARVIPLGGANGLGTSSFAAAAGELLAQCEQLQVRPSAVFVAAGTGSTVAGISLGLALAGSLTPVVAVSVSRAKERLSADIRHQQELALQSMGDLRRLEDLDIHLTVTDDQIGDGYTVPTASGMAAVALLARTEGVVADLSYTGKALAGLLEMPSASLGEGPVVFWHTGGYPELFGRDPETLVKLVAPSAGEVPHGRG